jgi:hypothetical protein
VPETIAKQILGKRAYTDLTWTDHEHVRDYTFTEVVGGSKGEPHDYMLVEADGRLTYFPIRSKVKLYKKRKAQVEMHDSDGEPIMQVAS